MLCSETDGNLPAIRYENLDKKTLSKLNKLIGALKSSVFEGNGFIGLFYTGGNVPKFRFEANVPNDEEEPLKKQRKKAS